MLAWIGSALVNGLAEVHPVVQHAIKVTFIDGFSVLVSSAFFGQFFDQDLGLDAPRKTFEDRLHKLCFRSR